MRAALLLVLPLALASCGPAGGKAEGGWAKRSGASAEAVPIRTEKLKKGAISQRLLTTSTVEAVRRVDLVPKSAGLVKTVLVREGGQVTAGEEIAKLDDEELKLAEKKALVNAAKAKADFEHSETLLKEKFISVDEFRKAEQAWKTSELELETAKLALAHAVIRAPIGGTLTRLDLQEGKWVATSAPVGELTDLTELECVIFVPEREVLKLSKDQPAEISSESLAATFGAKVKRVNPVIDKASGTAKAYLEVTDETKRLRPGMFVDVSIVIETHADAVLVPKKGLVFDEGEPGIYVVEGDTAKWKLLTLGYQEKDIAEVAKGAAEGDEIIVVGQNGLKDGMKVRVLKD